MLNTKGMTKNLLESITSSQVNRIKGLLTAVVFDSHICTDLTFELEITMSSVVVLFF